MKIGLADLIRRPARERVMRNQEQLLTDLCVTQALPTRVTRFCISQVGDSAISAERMCGGRRERHDLVTVLHEVQRTSQATRIAGGKRTPALSDLAHLVASRAVTKSTAYLRLKPMLAIT